MAFVAGLLKRKPTLDQLKNARCCFHGCRACSATMEERQTLCRTDSDTSTRTTKFRRPSRLRRNNGRPPGRGHARFPVENQCHPERQHCAMRRH
jgi:hypothetical protein